MISDVTFLRLSVVMVLRAAMCHRHRGADWGHFLPLVGRVQAWGSPTSGWQTWISFAAPAFRGRTALGNSPFLSGTLSPLVATPEEETVPFLFVAGSLGPHTVPGI